MKKEKTTSIRLTADGTKLVTKPSQKLGVTRSAVFELAIRALAEKEGLR